MPAARAASASSPKPAESSQVTSGLVREGNRTMKIERRQTPRSRVYRGASVVFNGRQSVLDCTLRNWSDTGALVRMSDWIALPKTFEIDIASGGESVRVRQCWRRGDDVGVAFLTPEQCQPVAPISLDAMRKRRQLD